MLFAFEERIAKAKSIFVMIDKSRKQTMESTDFTTYIKVSIDDNL